jgi:hypothetical protein
MAVELRLYGLNFVSVAAREGNDPGTQRAVACIKVAWKKP